MSPVNTTAAVPVHGGLLHHSASLRRPFPAARLLPLRGARPLVQVNSAPRRRPATAARAQSAPASGYLPDSEFYKIEAIVRPWRVSHVSSGLLQMGIRGVTVSDMRGYGAQGGSTERYEGLYIGEDKEAIVAGAVQLKKVAMMYAQARDPGAKTDGEMVQGRLLLTDG